MTDVGLDEVRAACTQELPVVPSAVQSLACRDRHSHPAFHLGKSFHVVRRDRLLEPQEVEVLKRMSDADGCGNVESPMPLDEEVDFLPHALDDGSHTVYRRLQFRARDIHVCRAERVPLEALEPERHGRACLVGELVGGPGRREPAVGVARHGIADFAAQQLPYGRAKVFALYVPERHFDACQRAHQHGAATPVRIAIGVVPEGFDVVGISSDKAAFQLSDGLGHSQFAHFQRGFAVPADFGIGGDFHEDPVGAVRVAEERLYSCHFHRATSSKAAFETATGFPT